MRRDWLPVGIVVVMALLLITVVAWPVQEERKRSIDRQMSADLRTLESEVRNYYYDERELPDSLADLNVNEKLEGRVEKYKYEYEKQKSTTFELCATFNTDTTYLEDNYYSPYYYDYSYSSSSDSTDIHEAGRVCYDFQVTASRYYYPEEDSYYLDEYNSPIYNQGVEEL